MEKLPRTNDDPYNFFPATPYLATNNLELFAAVDLRLRSMHACGT